MSTFSGFLKGKEVVEVEFDSSVISYKDLVAKAKEIGCAQTVFTRSDKQQEIAAELVGKQAVRCDDKVKADKDQKYYLAKSNLRFIPLTELQATRINSALGQKQNAKDFLSPSQLKLLATIEEHPKAKWKSVLGSKDFIKEWREIEKFVSDIKNKKE